MEGDTFPKGDVMTSEAVQVLSLALNSLESFGHSWIDTEHVLMGLAQVSPTQEILALQGITEERIRKAIHFLIGAKAASQHVSNGNLVYSPQLERVMILARECPCDVVVRECYLQ